MSRLSIVVVIGLSVTFVDAPGSDGLARAQADGEGPIEIQRNEPEGEEPGAAEREAAEREAGEPEASSQAPRYDENLDQAARLTFQTAREAFSQGDYETALSRFEQAYSLSPRPVLLYNIAVTLDRLRRDEEAVAKFREYLERVPDAPDRAEVEARLAVLERAIAEREAREAAEGGGEGEGDGHTEIITIDPDPDEGEPEDEGSSGLHPAIALSVAGAAVAVGGLIVWSGLDAQSKNDDFESYATTPGAELARAEQMFDDVESAETRTNALIGVAAGLAAGAAVLMIFTDWGGEDDPTAPTVSVGPDGAFVGATGRF